MQVALVCVVLYWWVFAVRTDMHDFAYNLGACSIFFQLITASVCAWLLQQRARAAGTAIVVSLCGYIAFGTALFVQSAVTGVGVLGTYPLPNVVAVFVFLVAGAVAVGLYFRYSPRMRAVLVRRLGRTWDEREARKKPSFA